jgi:hypothetical protein
MTACPSELKLELHLLDPTASAVAGHVARCPDCRVRLDAMERLGAEFRAQVFPATVEWVVGAARPGRTLRWLLAWAPFPALAAAGALLFLVPAPRPPDDYVGLKGVELGLAVFAQVQGAARAVGDGDRVPAASALRFQLKPSAPCRLWLVSVDGAGQVSRLYPATGEASAPLGGPGPLPGGAVLDGRPGPERIYAVCTREPLAFSEVERAARAAAAGGVRGVRSGGALHGLPRGAAQATLLLEKGP